MASREEFSEPDTAALATRMDDLNTRLSVVLATYRAQAADPHQSRLITDAVRNLERQIEDTRHSYSLQIAEAVRSRDEERQARLVAESTLTDSRRKLDHLQNSFKIEKERTLSLEEALTKTQGQLAAKKSEFETLRSNYDSLQTQAQILKDKASSLEHQLSEAQENADQYFKEFNLYKIRAESAESTIQSVQVEFEEKIEKLQIEFGQSREVEDGLESRLRMEFSQQLEEIISERQEIYAREKTQLLDDQRRLYETKISQMSREFSDKMTGYNDALLRIEELDTTCKALTEQLDQEIADKKILQSKFEVQSKKIEDLQTHPIKGLARKDQQIRELRELLDNQQKEMRELEEARIRLDSEIKTYETLLKEEFWRIEQTRKKRRLSVSGSTNSEFRTPLKFMNCNSYGKFEIFNQSNEPIDASGWKVVLAGKSTEFNLPQVLIEGGERLTFWYGQHEDVKDAPPQNNYWQDFPTQAEGGDKYLFELVNDGVVVDSFSLTFSQKTKKRQSCRVQ